MLVKIRCNEKEKKETYRDPEAEETDNFSWAFYSQYPIEQPCEQELAMGAGHWHVSGYCQPADVL